MPCLFPYGTLQQKAVEPATVGRLLEGRWDELVGIEQSLLIIDDACVVETSGETEHLMIRRRIRRNYRAASDAGARSST